MHSPASIIFYKMDLIFVNRPETPDPYPDQLTLFDIEYNAETVRNSTDSAPLCLSTEPHVRSPTDPAEMVLLENGKKFELNHFQRIFASSLLRKSRELVRKRIEEFKFIDTDVNDLAR